MNISIYICYNKKTDIINDTIFKYIYCGAALNKNENFMPGTLRDDNGENISCLNKYFNILTAIYWVWKNDHESDYIGFMSTRHQLNFSQKQDYPLNSNGFIEFGYTSDTYLKEMCLDSRSITKYLDDLDIILPKPGKTAKPLSQNNDEPRKALTIISKNLSSCANFALEAVTPLPTNCFIMKRELFEKLCNFIFPLLLEIHRKNDYQNQHTQEFDLPYKMADILFAIFVQNYIKNNKKPLRLAELQPTYILYPYTVREIKWEDIIPVVMAFDNNYCKYAACCISSIIKNASPKNKYKIFVLYKNISEENKIKLSRMVNYDYFNIEFINVDYYFHNRILFSCIFPGVVNYRLIIPLLFSNYNKVIYIDGDTIFRKDINDLYKYDIDSFPIAGAQDIYIKCLCKRKLMIPPEIGISTFEDYYKKTCDLYGDIYINSGVLVFNIKNCNDINAVEESMQLVDRKFIYPDQDIINIVYANKKKILDLKWNVFNDKNNYEENKNYLSTKESEDYLSAFDDAYIIHFAGQNKPWFNRSVSFAEEFWKYAKSTPYYKELRTQYLIYIYRPVILDILNKIIFPKNSIRRKIAKSIYIKYKMIRTRHTIDQ